MKYEAFHFEKSFEHSPKTSKQLNNIIVFNDFNIENQMFKKISQANNDTLFYT